MSYVRFEIQQIFGKETVDIEKLKTTKIVNLEFENECLWRYKEIVEYVIDKLN